MKYTTDDALKEIKRRGEHIREKHDRRVNQVLTLSGVIIAVVLVCVLGVFTQTSTGTTETVYGSFLLPIEAGGYILTAILSFTLGVIVTVLIRNYRKKNRSESEKNRD